VERGDEVSAGVQVDWQTIPLLGFDVESTGVAAHEDRIVTASIVVDQPGTPNRPTDWLINPGIPIPDEAAQVHGWTTERLAESETRTPAEALFEITGRLALWMGRGFGLVAMNAAYDVTMLEAENRRHGLPTLAERVAPKPIGPIIDPGVLDKYADPYRPAKCDGQQKRAPRCTCGAESKKLTDLCKHYGVTLENAHSSDADALAAVHLARAVIGRHRRKFAGLSLGALHMHQITWRREQMDSLREYFDKKGTEHDGCDGGWPIMSPPPAPVAPPVEAEGALL
jgi:DNA polymerase-3 subunit epsilon